MVPPMTIDDEPLPAWDDALRVRFARAGFDPETMRSWWCDEHLAGPEHDVERRGYLAQLRETEETQGPPTVREMDRRLQVEAELDPGMPAWIRRPWYVPRDRMLAVEAILVEVCGFGYSASGASFIGERHLAGDPHAPGLCVSVHPVPGKIPESGARREAAEARILRGVAGLGLRNPRVNLSWDAEPSKAFHGLMAGRIVRLGHVALGIPYETNYGDGF